MVAGNDQRHGHTAQAECSGSTSVRTMAEVVKAGTDSRRSPAIAVAPSPAIGMERNGASLRPALRAQGWLAAAGAPPKTCRRWKRKDGGRTLWVLFA